MREQQREAPAPVDVDVAGAVRKKPHERLSSIIGLAQDERDPDEQRRLSTELVETLIAMRSPGDEAEEARLLLAHLDAKTLRNLSVDAQGHSPHQEAVETLLSLGFPHALSVSPEDLELLRLERPSVGTAALWVQQHRAQASWIALVAQGGALAYTAIAAPHLWPWTVSAAALGVTGALWLRASRALKHLELPFTLLGASGGVLFLGGMMEAPLWIAIAAMAASLAMGQRGSQTSPETEDDDSST